MNLRWIVLKILDGIEFEDIFVHEAIEKQTKDLELSKQDRGFIKKLVFGSIEHRIYIDYVIDQYSKVKVKKMKPAIRHVMRLSVYQLLFMENIPESAVCNEAVKLVKKRKMHSLTGFANGVLRQIIRSKDNIELPDEVNDPALYLSVKYSFEKALVDYLLKVYTYKRLAVFFATSNEEAPLTIRCNRSKTTLDDLKKSLEIDSVTYKPAKWVEDAMYLSDYDRLLHLKSFNEGKFTVQDESSMLVGVVGSEALEGKSDVKVLDMCSAPGGKALHMADILRDNGHVTSFDVTNYKLDLIHENIRRLGYKNMTVSLGDATVFNKDYEAYADLVIADVPCSGLGIIRKKPDIKWHITKEKIHDLSLLQRQILDNVKNYVANGGVLIYSTCTITPAENEDNVKWFLKNNDDFELEKIDGPYAHTKTGMVQLHPISDGPDGFFIAKLRKKSIDE